MAPLLWGVSVALLLGTARADKVSDLGTKLEKSADFRIRTQAALALGASRDARAISYLCRGLNDGSKSVRSASAAGLGKLRKGGAQCLAKRLDSETEESVKEVIRKALQLVGPPKAPPAITAATKYYVTVEVRDGTGRSGDGVSSLVRKGMTEAASATTEVSVAPPAENVEASQKLLSEHPAVRGFLLATSVEQPQYQNGGLTVRLEVAIFTFPERNLKGSFSRQLGMQGITSRDVRAEDELIQAAAQSCLKLFAQTAPRIPP